VNMGDGEEFQIRSQLQQPSQFGMCALAHCRAGAERLELVCPSFYVRFLDADVSLRLHGRYRYCTTLLQIGNHDYLLTIPKN
jgi:hypothetical protein